MADDFEMLPDLSKIKLPQLPTPGAAAKQKRKQITSVDLMNIADASGHGEEARQIVASKGEESDRIFSGGIISDTFDALNMLQYGVVGMFKGKSFIEGVKTRQSWAQKDALGDFGLPGVIVGTLLDIAFDPLTYITPWTIFKHIPGAQKLGAAASKAAAGTKAGQWALKTFKFMGGQDPVFVDSWNRMVSGIAKGNETAIDLGKKLATLDTDASKIAKIAMGTGDFSKVTPEILKKMEPAYEEVIRLQKELHRYGHLSDELRDASLGQYMPRLFKVFEDPSLAKDKMFMAEFNTARQNLDRLMTRHDKFGFTFVAKRGGKTITSKFDTEAEMLKEMEKLVTPEFAKAGGRITSKFSPIPEETLEAMGEITTAAYPTAKGISQMNAMVERSKFFRTLADSHLVDDVMQEGFKQLPVTRKLGELSGKYIHGPAHAYLTEMVKPATNGVWKKTIAGFKFGKVILNPAAHARNIMSNLILNNMEGMNLANPRTWKNYMRSFKEVTTKGDWWKAGKKWGLGADSGFASQEILNILKSTEGLEAAGKWRKVWDNTGGRMAKLYQGEEEFAKMAQFMHQAEGMGAKTIDELANLADPKILEKLGLQQGLTIGEASARVAERATFNYAQVSPFVRKLRENVWGMPFITFTAKATPQVAKTIVKHPARLSWIGKAKNSIESMAGLSRTKRERAAEPQWVKDGFYVKLPMKDKHGRSAYFDLTYIIPFGDLISGQLFERQVDRETGLPESHAESLIKKAPVINLITEIGKNQDFYGNKIWRNSDSSDKQMMDLLRHVTKTYLPPLIADQIPGGYISGGKQAGQRRPGIWPRVKEAGKENQYRTLTQEVLRNVGVKVQPVNIDVQERYSEYEKKKALQTMLGEKGVIQEFRRSYVPKKK